MRQNNTNILASVREELRNIITSAVNKAKEKGLLNLTTIPDFSVQKPDQKEYGDLSTSLPLMLSKEAKLSPRQVAERIVSCIEENDLIRKVEIAGPGFMNFFLTDKWLHDLLRIILNVGHKFGETDIGKGQRVQVEFVSANPVGPLNVVSARAASVGDSIANLLSAIGYQVERESYANDAGVQVDTLAKSIEVRYRQLLGEDIEFPDEGYHGDYVRELAEEMLSDYGKELLLKPDNERREILKDEGVKRILEGQKKDLLEFGVKLDVWASEKAIRQSGKMDEVIQRIQRENYAYKSDGAVWFKSTYFGDDRDRVMIKSDGEVTYMVPDLAYHLDKLQRGFKKVIDIWGPDHHGYIPRMKAGIQALGIPPDWLEILIVQQVNLLQGGQTVRMSKRAGQFVTLRQLIDELSPRVGRRFAVDVARFFFQMRSTSAHLDFDMDLAIQQADVNPVFYIQYAHARICSIFRQAEERGIDLTDLSDADPALLQEEEELDLMKKLSEFPDTVYESAISMEPQKIARYLQDLSAIFHSFYNKHKVLDAKEEKLTKARALLVNCVRIVLQKGLKILGISAPESM